jgi:hypothetical protein
VPRFRAEGKAASIAVSVCPTIGALVADCSRMSSPEGELKAQSSCDFFNSPLISNQGDATTVGCQP